MIGRRQLVLAGAAVALSAALARPARASDLDRALARIKKAREGLQTLQAGFTQKRIIGLLASEVVSKGRLTLVRPDRLRWELEPPDAVTYWIGPEGLAMANQDGVTKVGKAAAGRFASVLGDLLIMLGGDLTKLKKRYALSVSEADKTLVLTAKPTAADVKKHVSMLRLEAASDTLWQVRRIEIHEKNGDKSIIDFGAFTKNKPVKPDYMKPP